MGADREVPGVQSCSFTWTPGIERWRERPVVVEAARWMPDDLLRAGELVGWLVGHGADFHHPSGIGGAVMVAIRTPDGELLAGPGDWIVKGTQGEFYPVKAAVFAEAFLQDAAAMNARVYDMSPEDCERWYAEHPVEMYEAAAAMHEDEDEPDPPGGAA